MKASHIAMQAITGTDSAKGKGYSERIEIEQHIEYLIKEYAKQKCKEQRQKFINEYKDRHPERAEWIKNAPELEFD